MVSEQGDGGTRLSDIARRANVRTPAIYYHFSSREHLLEEVMHEGAVTMLTRHDDAMAALPSDSLAIERITVAVDVHLRTELSLSDYAKALIRNSSQLSEGVAGRALVAVREYIDRWRVLLDTLEQEGSLRPGLDVSVARMFVLSALNGAPDWYVPGRGALDHVVDQAQVLILGSLVAPGNPGQDRDESNQQGDDDRHDRDDEEQS